jgi:Domain of unknown function (DUF3291)
MSQAPLLAQVNVARLRFPIDSPHVREFFAALDRINRLADVSPGFVWRKVGGEGHKHGTEETGDPRLILNLSVWRSYEHLHDYVYRSAHAEFLRRRYEWFERMTGPATALWWVPAGHEPRADEALARLRLLRTYGPAPQAFTPRCRFTPDGRRVRGRR